MPVNRDPGDNWPLVGSRTTDHPFTGHRPPRARPRRRWVDLSAPLLALLLISVPVAIAAPDANDGGATAARGEGRPIELGERNPGSGGSARETAIVANAGNGGLVVRPSNTAKGGRAISATCDNDGLEAEDGCAVYVNKGQGAAASFRTQGSVPFAIRDTNNGLVQHLNADRVDNLHASDIVGQARAKAGLDADTVDGQNPGDIVGQARTKEGLDADSVDGFSANSLVRGAFGETLDAPDGDGPKATATIDAPTSGLLFVTGSSSSFNLTQFDIWTCTIQVNDTTVPESERTIGTDGDENVNSEENCMTNVVEPVPAGTHKVDFEASGVASNTGFADTVVQVIFIPFGPTGAQP